MLAARRAAGGSTEEFERDRDAFVKDWLDHAPTWRGNLWLAAYAAVASTERDAQIALEKLAASQPLPPFRAWTLWVAEEGAVHLLAGDAARALPLLERGVRVCITLARPVERMRALLHLGMAREATGDRAGACEAYQRVLARWGSAKPRSVTADDARHRAAALACSR
jgi:serine/threonine-protein kinase